MLLVGGLLASAAAQGVGRFVLTPLLPDMRAAAGLDAAQAGIVAGANFAGYLAASIWLALRAREGRIGAVPLGFALVLAGAFAMALAPSYPLWIAARAAAGYGGTLLFLGSLDAYARAARAPEDLRPLAGVGIGIALSCAAGLPWLSDWRSGWLVAGALGVLAAPFVLRLPRGAAAGHVGDEPAPALTGPLARLSISYAAYGFAFGAAATFFVNAIASGDRRAAALVWVVVGVFAAPSVWLWSWVRRRVRAVGALFAANVLHAASILLVALDPHPFTATIAGMVFGATFLGVPALSLAQARILAPRSARRITAWVTVLFGLGQMAGPPAIGWLGERLGSLAHGLLAAAAAGALAALLLLPDLRRR